MIDVVYNEARFRFKGEETAKERAPGGAKPHARIKIQCYRTGTGKELRIHIVRQRNADIAADVGARFETAGLAPWLRLGLAVRLGVRVWLRLGKEASRGE